MPQPLLPLPTSPHEQRRGPGRPKGSTNKRAGDVAKWVEVTFGGRTPAQVSAHLALVTPAEIRKAKDQARELGIVDLGLPAHQLALVVKAHIMSRALGVTRAEAWAMMTNERGKLMPYVHQQLPTKAEPKADEVLPMVIMMGDGPDPGAAIDATEGDPERLEFLGEIQTPTDKVG